MLKSIFIQLWNRKRSNIWLFFELLLVFCFVWYIVEFLFVVNYNRSIHDYKDYKYTWQINISEYDSKNPKFQEEENTPEERLANYNRILRSIQSYPGIEAVGISFNSSTPGSTGMHSISHGIPGDSTKKSLGGQLIFFDPQWDFFKVFRFTTDNGSKLLSVDDYDWNIPNGLLVGKLTVEQLFDGIPPIGKELGNYANYDNTKKILGVVDDTKRFAFQRPRNTYWEVMRLNDQNIRQAEISVRMNASVSDKSFQQQFMEVMPDKLQVGNFYLKNIISYKKREELAESLFGLNNMIKIQTGLMIFFLLSIVLCVIGTFWYRVNVRREEIGLRKALGSTKNGIRNLLIEEGICILLIVVIVAMIIEYQFVHAGLMPTFEMGGGNDNHRIYLPDKTFLRFLITNGITFLIMVAVTVLAIWLPATKAAELEAADALRDE